MKSIVEIALRQYGVKEFPGEIHNPIILAYSDEIGYGGIIKDETAWCSIFMNWCAMRAGVERSGKLDARSWLKVGETVSTPKLGDTVVLWREDPESWKGHVGIFMSFSEDRKRVYILGGNQNNMVCIKPYPVSKVLGFRNLRPVESKEVPNTIPFEHQFPFTIDDAA